MIDRATLQQIIEHAEQIFLAPQPQYSWQAIITGVNVRSLSSNSKMAAVSQNTWRGFHKINKLLPGAAEGFRGYLLDNADQLLRDLAHVGSVADLDVLMDRIGDAVKARLTNIKPKMLGSYNKIRKPLDLYLEHQVAMARELAEVRSRLTPWLRLPLDSQMFQLPHLFSEGDLHRLKLSRQSTYQDVASTTQYQDLQHLVQGRVREYSTITGRPFHPIYFDLWWNDRYRRSGGNLFEVNLG